MDTVKNMLLEPFTEKHLTERYVHWMNDLETVKFSEQRHQVHTLDSCRTWQFEMERAGNPVYAIVVEGEHIGNVSADIDLANSTGDVGILLGERRGEGLGRQAWREMLDRLALRKITCGFMSVNTPMQRVAYSCGMSWECTRPRHFLFEGNEVDLVNYALYKEV